MDPRINYNRDDFGDDLFQRKSLEPSSRESLAIDDNTAFVGGLLEVYRIAKTFIQNRFSGPSLLDQIGEAVLPKF